MQVTAVRKLSSAEQKDEWDYPSTPRRPPHSREKAADAPTRRSPSQAWVCPCFRPRRCGASCGKRRWNWI